MTFEWDDDNRGHIARHHVTPEEAVEVFYLNPLVGDPKKVRGEIRTRMLGVTTGGRILEVVFTVSGDKIRVVTAFPANKSARKRWKERG